MSIVKAKDGRVKVTHDKINESNIYQFLRDIGYRKSKLGNKRIYFLRQGANIIPVRLQDMKNAFLDMLRRIEFLNIPEFVRDYSVILNWFHQQEPIKENRLFNLYLTDDLTDEEMHQFRLKTECDYRHNFERQQLISKLGQWGFEKTTGTMSEFYKDSPLYYRPIGDKKYVIFRHYNHKHNDNDGFDVHIVTFARANNIHCQIPKTEEIPVLSFQIERDVEKIRSYFQ